MSEQKYLDFDKIAEEAYVEPLHLRSNGEVVAVIKNPTGVQIMRMHEAGRQNDIQAMMWAICGEEWPKVESLLVKSGHGAVDPLLDHILEHFGLSEDVVLVGPGGGEITERRRSKIVGLLQKGYKVKGEA